MLLAAPLLALCFVAAYDAVLCLETRHRLGRAASMLARTLASSGAPAEVDPAPAFAAAARLAAPADLARAEVIVTLLAPLADGPPRAIWRRRLAPLDGTVSAQADGMPHVTLSQGRLAVVAVVAIAPEPWVVGAGLARAWLGDVWRVVAIAPVPAPTGATLP